MLSDEVRYRIFKRLTVDPHISQRDLARELDVSVGKVNYCLQALIEKGFVKVNNFRNNKNKLAYAYLLTPHGIEEKTRVTVTFLQRKVREYAELQEEIEVLRQEVLSSPDQVRSKTENHDGPTAARTNYLD